MSLLPVKLSLLGETVQILSDQSPQMVEKVSGYLNKRVQEVGKGSAASEKFRVLALAALSISGEVIELQAKLEEHDQEKLQMLAQIKSLTKTLDSALA